MELTTTLRALRTGWYLIAIGVLLGCAAAVWVDGQASPEYTATGSFVVSPGSVIADDDVAQGVDTLDSSRSRSIMTTLTEITDSDAVRGEAFAALGLDRALIGAYSVESVVVPEANVMETSVTGPDPAIAAALATALGEVGGVRFAASYRIYAVDVLDAAAIPAEPSNPGLVQLLVVAGAVGAMVGGAMALLRSSWLDRADRSVQRRLGAYDPDVTAIEEHSRFKRAG